MYGKIASTAFGLLAVANARPAPQVTPAFTDVVHSVTPSASIATTTTAAVTPAFTDVVHSVTPSSSSSALTVGGTSVPATFTSFPTGGVYSGNSSHAAKFPLPNGFPNIAKGSPQLTTLEQQAHGELSNGAAPTNLHPDTVNSLAFIAFNELFEVSFFTQLVDKIVKSAPGFTSKDIPADRDTVLADLKVIVAQEELHALNALGAFNANTGKTVAPCTYKFPVKTFSEAIALASKFTDVVLGTLPDIQTVAAENMDIGLVRAVGSVVGQEGEQNGFFRSLSGKVPSELPFLTASARNFAYNAILQNFVEHCPSETIDLLEMPAAGTPLNETGVLNVLTTKLGLEDVTAAFSIQTVDTANTEAYYKSKKGSQLYITYINQQNTPISYKISDLSFSAGAIHFKAPFKGKTDFLNGLTIAAVTNKDESMSDVDTVASDMIFGPGLIEVN
ncbi:uncharacterized protein LTR77_010578 [Saxophila tyrrhenica]|uniref:Sexual development protein n=1 Tax=Saxophila tyrrhenica TaxID=1690608 RepID=A0AAV9NYT2_9PEZI|nr:hypothetical protein LTR77_010578 [Saxophila tyrrhenica]